MFLVGILSWWYGKGFLRRVQIIKDRLSASADFFSIGLLFSTLFAPYRQISAEKVTGSVADQTHAFFDRSLSRLIGAFVRTFMIIFGLITMFSQIVFGIIVIISWLTIPLLPVIGLIAWVIGWVPKWMN